MNHETTAAIETLAVKCADEAFDQGATKVCDPMDGDWYAFRGLVGGHESEHVHEAKLFAKAYRVRLAERVDA